MSSCRPRLGMLLGGVLLLSLTTHCTTMARWLGFEPAPPKVELKRVDIRAVSFPNLDLGIVLDVTNTGEKAVTLESAEYRIELLENLLAAGRYATPVSIPAGSKRSVDVPLSVDLRTMESLAKALMAGEREIAAKISGVARLKGALGVIAVPFQAERRLGAPN